MNEPTKPTLSADAREKLKDKLDAIHLARKPIQEVRKPFDDALRAIDALHDAAVEEAGVELLDDICEGCECILVVGDLGHRCGDGPVLCEACAPTWNDMAAQCREPDYMADDPEGRADALAAVEAHIAAGLGDEKNVLPL